MTEPVVKPVPAKRKSWLRKLGWVGGGMAVVLVVVYFVGTSGSFFKSVILPKVSAAMGAEVSVADAQISPFSHVVLKDVKVQPRGSETLVTVKEVSAAYSLWSILGGNISIQDVTVESPVVTLITNPEGASNLEAMLKAQPKSSKPAETPKSGKTPQLDIKRIALNNATVRVVKNYRGGAKDVTEISGLNFTLSDLRNAHPGKIKVDAGLSMEKAAQPATAAGSLSAKLAGAFDFALTPELKPASARGKTTFTVDKASGSLADLAAFGTTLDCELTTTELKELALRLTKGGEALGEIHLSGPFDTAKSEGKLKLEILSVDKRALNLAGAASGVDFGTTTIRSTNTIEFAKGGKLITTAGRLDLSQFQVTRQNQTSPTLDLQGQYAIIVDQVASSVVLNTFSLTGSQNSRPLLITEMPRPLTLKSGSTSGVGDASLKLVITNLNLMDWKAFAGDSAPEGLLNLEVKLISQNGGKQLGFDLDTHLDHFATGKGAARVEQGEVHTLTRGSLADFKQLKLDDFQVTITQKDQSKLKLFGSGTFDAQAQAADFQVNLKTAVSVLLALPNQSATNGAVDFKGHLVTKQKSVALTGSLNLTPTARATNELQMDLKVDATDAAAITGNVNLNAAALDVTSYFDLLGSKPVASTATKPSGGGATAAASPATGGQKEPDPIKLPLKGFTVNLKIAHFFLKEVDLSNWQTTTLLDGSHVLVKPCVLNLNNAPAGATVDLDLSVPGYKYDIALNANAIPLAPFVNSFMPDRKGQVAGNTSTEVRIKGTGTTGESLQKNLSGLVSFTTTNMSLSIANVRSPLMNSIINVIVGIPDLIQNPAAEIGNLFGAITGQARQNNGWADQLTAAPIDVISLNARITNGFVQVQQVEVLSKAFQTLVTGDVTLAPVMTNSPIQMGVKVALAPGMAERIGLANAGSTNPAYVFLPDFLKLKGTVGSPKTEIDKLAIVKLAARTGGGLAKKLGVAGGEKAESFVNAVGGFFGGNKTNAPTGSNTNTPATTNGSPVNNILNLFKKPK